MILFTLSTALVTPMVVFVSDVQSSVYVTLALTLAGPVGFVSITQLACFVRTGRGTRGDDGSVEAGLSNKVDFDGGIAARVVDRTRVNLGDRHDCYERGQSALTMLLEETKCFLLEQANMAGSSRSSSEIFPIA